MGLYALQIFHNNGILVFIFQSPQRGNEC